MLRETNTVWVVYDKLRTAKLNLKYYSRRLESIERQYFWIEAVLLITAPTSALAGSWLWSDPTGKFIWQIIGVAAAFAALLKPLMGLQKKIKDFESLLLGYQVLTYDLLEIKTMIEQKQKYDSQLQNEFKKVIQKEKMLVSKIPEPREKSRIKKICEKEVNRELPSENFYVPTQ